MPLEAQLKQYNDENNTNFHFSELLSGNCVEKIPREAGVYAWYFKNIPDNVPIDDCEKSDDLTLLYVGIAGNGNNTLWHRIGQQHYNGNAEGSTLRYTLGCLLSEKLQIQLRMYRNQRKRFSYQENWKEGEGKLSEWMKNNTYISYCKCTNRNEASQLETWLISHISLPLNLKDNNYHPFHANLTNIRRCKLQKSRTLPNLHTNFIA